MAPQNREKVQSSLEQSLHVTLRSQIEALKPLDAEPDGEQPRPDISNGESQGN